MLPLGPQNPAPLPQEGAQEQPTVPRIGKPLQLRPLGPLYKWKGPVSPRRTSAQSSLSQPPTLCDPLLTWYLLGLCPQSFFLHVLASPWLEQGAMAMAPSRRPQPLAKTPAKTSRKPDSRAALCAPRRVPILPLAAAAATAAAPAPLLRQGALNTWALGAKLRCLGPYHDDGSLVGCGDKRRRKGNSLVTGCGASALRPPQLQRSVAIRSVLGPSSARGSPGSPGVRPGVEAAG